MRSEARTYSHRRQRLPLKFCSGALAMLIACLGVLAWSAPVLAAEASLTLSTNVSDGPTPPNVNLLDATITFSLDSSPIALPTEVLITFENQTTAPNDFVVNEILFNIPDNVTSLSLTTNPAWIIPDSHFCMITR